MIEVWKKHTQPTEVLENAFMLVIQRTDSAFRTLSCLILKPEQSDQCVPQVNRHS